jgi:hypothetical protein
VVAVVARVLVPQNQEGLAVAVATVTQLKGQELLVKEMLEVMDQPMARITLVAVVAQQQLVVTLVLLAVMVVLVLLG